MNPILIVTPFRNAAGFIAESARRSLSQLYGDFRIVFVDDNSTDASPAELAAAIAQYGGGSKCRDIHVVRNDVRRYPLQSTHDAVVAFGCNDDIVVTVDGDDWLLHDDVLTFVNNLYEENGCWVTYGNAHWQPEGGQTVIPGPYSPKELATLRTQWSMPDHAVRSAWRIHHLRTFRCWLYNEIGRRDPGWRCLKDENGAFYKAAGDVAVMLPLVEMAGFERTLFNPINLYVYNLHAANEHVVSSDLQWQAVRQIFARPRMDRCGLLAQAAAPRTDIEVRFLEPARYCRGNGETHGGSQKPSPLVLSEINCHARNNGRKFIVPASPNERHVIRLDGKYQSFEARVGLDGTSQSGGATVDFIVSAGGRPVAAAYRVTSLDTPQVLATCIAGETELELTIRTTGASDRFVSKAEIGANWIEPHVGRSADNASLWWEDSLGRTEIELPRKRRRAKRCIAMVVSPGFETMADHALSTIQQNAGCDEALIALFCIGESERIDDLVAKYAALRIRCRPLVAETSMVKSVLYSAANVIDADQFVCIDADVLVLESLSPVFEALNACEESSILVAREANDRRFVDLGHAFADVYRGTDIELRQMLRGRMDLARYPFVVNEGVYAGNRTAFLALDSLIRGHKFGRAWIDARLDCQWRHQFLFNLALARLECAVELAPEYNVQLQFQNVDFVSQNGMSSVLWTGRKVRVLHFNGADGRPLYAHALRSLGMENSPPNGTAMTMRKDLPDSLAIRSANRLCNTETDVENMQI